VLSVVIKSVVLNLVMQNVFKLCIIIPSFATLNVMLIALKLSISILNIVMLSASVQYNMKNKKTVLRGIYASDKTFHIVSIGDLKRKAILYCICVARQIDAVLRHSP
jgi:hypothetical protein